MQTINYTTARAHLAETMDRVNEDRAPLLVTRQKGEPVVMMSLAEYNALEETAYLLRSPANAAGMVRPPQPLALLTALAVELVHQTPADAHRPVYPGTCRGRGTAVEFGGDWTGVFQ